MTTPMLAADARNRALRTFLQGLGFTVLSAIVLILLPVLTTARSFDDIDWDLLTWSLFQSAGVAVLSYLMRTVLDRSRVPTPLPPADPGEPDAEPGESDR